MSNADVEVGVAEVKPEALLLALACVGTDESRPQLHRVLLSPDGFVVATNGHSMSLYREGWAGPGQDVTRRGDGLLVEASGKARTALVAVCKRALAKGGDVLFSRIAGSRCRAWNINSAHKAEAFVQVYDQAQPYEFPYPESWRQVVPHGDRVAAYTGPVPCFNGQYLGTFGDALAVVNMGGGSAILHLLPTGPRSAAVVRSLDPNWVGVIMPLLGDRVQGWDLETSSTFLGTHGKSMKAPGGTAANVGRRAALSA